MRGVWRRHSRFLVALAVGALAVLVAPRGIIDRVLLGGDLFFAVYLAASGLHARHLTAGDLRRHGREDDEGAGLIVALAVAAIALSLSAVIGALGTAKGQGSALQPLLAVLSVPLGWATLHMVMAFHYASRYYARQGSGKAAGGLDFPDTHDPGVWDFVYFSFTLGMTAQTSDVAIRDTRLRRIATLHSALSFFFNTVILALAVNLAVSLG
ncbi:MAG: DUF1345 domain-containing protein [Paracoccus sp. (in: a-proteobacteria)]|uniref:DUF1345 domain-containing protein n=1 Tax=Paracoccus sp. TaxID=267 RepID=UPI0040598813